MVRSAMENPCFSVRCFTSTARADIEDVAGNGIRSRRINPVSGKETETLYRSMVTEAWMQKSGRAGNKIYLRLRWVA